LAEKALLTQPALAVEERLKELWHASRGLDRHMGRTRTGVHRSDLMVHYRAKNQPASACSTGEQKALMLSLLLAVVRARHTQTGACPVVLLDEVIAHLDAHRRAALFAQLLDLGAQTWMTGTDESVFAPLGGRAQLFRVRQDAIQPQ
jgi:DNA replication and repair protein RecF